MTDEAKIKDLEERIKYHEETHQLDIQAMLAAIALIARAQFEDATQVLIMRLPEYLSKPLKAGK